MSITLVNGMLSGIKPEFQKELIHKTLIVTDGSGVTYVLLEPMMEETNKPQLPQLSLLPLLPNPDVQFPLQAPKLLTNGMMPHSLLKDLTPHHKTVQLLDYLLMEVQLP